LASIAATTDWNDDGRPTASSFPDTAEYLAEVSPISTASSRRALASAARTRFDDNHAQVHGHAAKERGVEVVSYRVRLRVSVPKYQPREEAASQQPVALNAAIKGARAVYFDGETPTQAALYERDRLDIGAGITGPAIIEQFDATTVIPPCWTGRVDAYGNLILEPRR